MTASEDERPRAIEGVEERQRTVARESSGDGRGEEQHPEEAE